MMNHPSSFNLVRPNMPLRKPSSIPVVSCAVPHSVGRAPLLGASPVRPAQANNGQVSIQSPSSSILSPTNRALLDRTPPGLTGNHCNVCGQQGNFRCKRCKKIAYCSVVCQTEDWKVHRHMCKAIDLEPAKEKPTKSFALPVKGNKSDDLAHTEFTNIQRVFLKDLPLKVIKGIEIKAAVVEFQNPGRFFIVAQSPETLEALQTITLELQKTYSFPFMTAHKPFVEEVCAVQYSCDLNWYRGLVQNLAADQDTAHILYIDFGNEEIVPFDRIKPLAAKLQQFGPCAMECCIAGVVPTAGMWSGKCRIAVWQLLKEKTVTIQVLETLENGRVHAVDIVLSEGNTLSSFLLEHEYAEKETVNKTPTEQDKNAIESASLENFKRLSVGKDDNSWAQAPEPLTQAVGDSFSVVVTHFQSPEKIVVQKVDDAGFIQDLQIKLREHCCQAPVSRIFRPAPGTVCCALFSEDKQWYRAKVLAYSSEERVCVGYLDFGNSEDVDLSSLCPISQALLAVPMQAMSCGLSGVQHVGESWSEECLLALQRRISNRILRIEIQGAQEGKALVTITDEASDPQANIAELLISAGYATPAVVNNNNDQPTDTPSPAPEVFVSSPKQQPLVWSCAELSAEGHTVALQVCYVESPAKFFCHINNPTEIQRLKDLEAELKPYCEAETSPFDPNLGEPCCAVFPGNQKCYRAMVKELYEDEVLVAFVDYGYCLRVKKSHLRPIIPRFLTLPFLALPCWLAGVEPQGSEWTSEALLWFQSLVDGGTLSARVLSVSEHGYGLELERDGKSVAAALVAEQLAKFPGEGVTGTEEAALSSNNNLKETVVENRRAPAQNNSDSECTSTGDTSSVEVPYFPVDWKTVVLPVNETFQPCIAAVSNPSLFYLFGPRQVSEEKLQEMMCQLAEYCNNQVSQSLAVTSKPVTGSACCARFTFDNKWYRAVVLEVCDQVASVIYADYGNSEKVSLSHILPIPLSFIQLPFQVTRCTLVGTERFPAEWPEEVQQVFMGALQHDVIATVQSFDGFANVLSLFLPTERGGIHVDAMILDALQAHSKNTTGTVVASSVTPARCVSNTDTKTETSETSTPLEIPDKVEDITTNQEVLTPEPEPQIPTQTKDDPVQRIKHMEPPRTTNAETQDALVSSCCCQSLKNKIDQLEQLMQVQLSLIKTLIAQKK